MHSAGYSQNDALDMVEIVFGYKKIKDAYYAIPLTPALKLIGEKLFIAGKLAVPEQPRDSLDDKVRLERTQRGVCLLTMENLTTELDDMASEAKETADAKSRVMKDWGRKRQEFDLAFSVFEISKQACDEKSDGTTELKFFERARARWRKFEEETPQVGKALPVAEVFQLPQPVCSASTEWLLNTQTL